MSRILIKTTSTNPMISSGSIHVLRRAVSRVKVGEREHKDTLRRLTALEEESKDHDGQAVGVRDRATET